MNPPEYPAIVERPKLGSLNALTSEICMLLVVVLNTPIDRDETVTVDVNDAMYSELPPDCINWLDVIPDFEKMLHPA